MYRSGAGGQINLGSTVDERILSYAASRSEGGLQAGSSIPLGSSFRGHQHMPLGSSFTGGLHSSYRPVDPQLSASFRGLPAGYGGVPMTEMGGESHNVELVALQNQLRASLAEEMRIRHALQMHDSVINKNREELNRYRAHLETRDEEMRKIMRMEDERMQMVLDEYKNRYDRERSRLQDALVKAANCAQVVSDGLAECLNIERQLFGYSSEELHTPRRPKPETPSLLQAMGGVNLDTFDQQPAAFNDHHNNAYPYGMGGSMGGSMSSERGYLDAEGDTMLA